MEALGAIGNRHPVDGAAEALMALRPRLAEAMDYAEDRDQRGFDSAHWLLDHVGRILRRHYPRTACTITHRDGRYWDDCPLHRAHIRAGLSAEVTTKVNECSLCGHDLDDCGHIPGRIYHGRYCGIVHREATITGAAIVARPRFPTARITPVEVTARELRAELGDRFTPRHDSLLQHLHCTVPGNQGRLRRRPLTPPPKVCTTGSVAVTTGNQQPPQSWKDRR